LEWEELKIMKTNGHDFVDFKFEFNGILIVVYFGNPIAMIDEDGQILMRDQSYPLYLVEYLVENMPMHYYMEN